MSSVNAYKSMVKVGDESKDQVVGKIGVPSKNENGDSLMDVCGEKRLFVLNTCFLY